MLFLLAMPLLYSVLVTVKQKFIQSHREERYSKELLQTLSIADEKLVWVKKDKEVIIDGQLFDVKSYTSENGNILLTGFFDHKENNLVQQLINLSRHNSASENLLSCLAITILFTPVVTIEIEKSYEGYWKYISQHYFPYDEMIPQAPVFPFIQPPKS